MGSVVKTVLGFLVGGILHTEIGTEFIDRVLEINECRLNLVGSDIRNGGQVFVLKVLQSRSQIAES